jgi:hypothetical protein
MSEEMHSSTAALTEAKVCLKYGSRHGRRSPNRPLLPAASTVVVIDKSCIAVPATQLPWISIMLQ